MKILITGGFGYIGGRLGKFLSECSMHHVFLGSRSHRQQPKWLKKGNVIQMDWDEQYSLLEACKNIDAVVHTAGMNAQECIEKPDMAFQVNGENTQKLITAATKKAVSKFIYMSTAHVYNESLNGIITEDCNLTNLHPYATSHVEGEKAAIAGHQKHNLQTIVVRLANSFGAPSNSASDCWKLVVNDLCKQAVIHRKLLINGPAGTMRNFIAMTDVCVAIKNLLNDKELQTRATICNLGGKNKTILDLATNIKKIFENEKRINLSIRELSENLSQNQDLDFRSSVLKARGFNLTKNFENELRKLINFCESQFENGNYR